MEFTKLARDIQIERDAAGVPHIQAKSLDDALYGLGYMHAFDRVTQILFARAIASGRAAETIAPKEEFLETDRFFRRVGLHRNQQRESEYWPEAVREQVRNYCAGVNDGMAATGASLPMWAIGFQAVPWDQMSVLFIGNLLSFGGLAVSQLENERILVELIQHGCDEAALRELMQGRLDHVDFELVKQVHGARRLSDDALELIMDLPRLAGSNAWVVSGSRTASGKPIIASDPHLEINRLPAIWYEAVMSWDDQYVMGATLPGCPLFAVGRTQDIAWGVTYMKGDTIDFFIEDCRKGENGQWQYRREDQWVDYEVREETILVRGKDPETMHVYENGQGTLDTDPEKYGPGYYFSLAWTGTPPRSGMAIASWLEMITARNATEAMEVASHCPQPTLCWVIADTEGNIGLQGNGRFPRRSPGATGLGPLAAWDARNHWQGFYGTDSLPRIYNPECGYIATANEEIGVEGGPRIVSQTLPDYRARRIREVLAYAADITPERMQELQYDLVSLQARDLLPELLKHAPQAMRDRLVNWDLRFSAESTEAVLFQRFYRNVLLEIFGHENGLGPRRTLFLVTRAGFSAMIIAACDALLLQEESLWWQKRDKGEMIRRAAELALIGPEETWGSFNNFHFSDRFFGGMQIGWFLGFDSPVYPMPGCHATIFQGHVLQTATRESTFAPSYHFVSDLSADEAWTNLPGGPSESRFSRYYKSDVPLWLNAEYKRLEVAAQPSEPEVPEPETSEPEPPPEIPEAADE